MEECILYVKYAMVMRFIFGNLTLALFYVSGKIPPEETHVLNALTFTFIP